MGNWSGFDVIKVTSTVRMADTWGNVLKILTQADCAAHLNGWCGCVLALLFVSRRVSLGAQLLSPEPFFRVSICTMWFDCHCCTVRCLQLALFRTLSMGVLTSKYRKTNKHTNRNVGSRGSSKSTVSSTTVLRYYGTIDELCTVGKILPRTIFRSMRRIILIA